MADAEAGPAKRRKTEEAAAAAEDAAQSVNGFPAEECGLAGCNAGCFIDRSSGVVTLCLLPPKA